MGRAVTRTCSCGTAVHIYCTAWGLHAGGYRLGSATPNVGLEPKLAIKALRPIGYSTLVMAGKVVSNFHKIVFKGSHSVFNNGFLQQPQKRFHKRSSKGSSLKRISCRGPPNTRCKIILTCLQKRNELNRYKAMFHCYCL